MGSPCAGDRTWAGTGLSRPLELGEAAWLGVDVGDGEGLGSVDAVGAELHAQAASATRITMRRLATAAQLPLDRRGDLVSGKVIEPVIMRAHAVRQVRASVDRVGLVHRRNSRKVLH